MIFISSTWTQYETPGYSFKYTIDIFAVAVLVRADLLLQFILQIIYITIGYNKAFKLNGINMIIRLENTI